MVVLTLRVLPSTITLTFRLVVAIAVQRSFGLESLRLGSPLLPRPIGPVLSLADLNLGRRQRSVRMDSRRRSLRRPAIVQYRGGLAANPRPLGIVTLRTSLVHRGLDIADLAYLHHLAQLLRHILAVLTGHRRVIIPIRKPLLLAADLIAFHPVISPRGDHVLLVVALRTSAVRHRTFLRHRVMGFVASSTTALRRSSVDTQVLLVLPPMPSTAATSSPIASMTSLPTSLHPTLLALQGNFAAGGCSSTNLMVLRRSLCFKE